MDTSPHVDSLVKDTHKVRSKRAPRRLRPISEKRRIVEETFEPGASIATVARRHEVNANLVFNWRKQYHAGILVEAISTKAPVLLPVDVPASSTEIEAVEGKTPTPRPRKEAGSIEIELSGGHRIRVNGRVDRTTLSRVISAVRR